MKERFHDIDALLVKYLLDEASIEEQAAVKEWIVLKDTHRAYYNDFKLIWEQSKTLAATSLLDEDIAWQKFRRRIHEVPVKKTPVISLRNFRWLRIAAMAILMMGLAVFGYKIFNTKEIKTLAFHSFDKVAVDTLPDRSVITLNKNSTLDYPEKFSGDVRTVQLKGEAFFSITPNKAKPFIIHANDVTIRVVGTSFNVKCINGNTEVIVETGIVAVTRNNKEIDLYPHESILVNKDDSTLSKEIERGTLYNYYRTKEFECDKSPLWQLVQVLNEAYNVHITIESKELRNLPLTTTFNNESLDKILDVIRQTFNLSVTKTGNEIILK
ncbi:MAG TPA: FecR domain-containing protein [Ginsengibacter sp.]|nr:FecR domain-containing protein [Ginsengibacter sp.]